MRRSIRSLLRSEIGSLTTTFALTAPIVGGVVALGIDLGRAELAQKQALRAAEASAVSAAVAYQANNDNDLNKEAR